MYHLLVPTIKVSLNEIIRDNSFYLLKDDKQQYYVLLNLCLFMYWDTVATQ